MALANNTTRARGKGGGKAGGATFARCGICANALEILNKKRFAPYHIPPYTHSQTSLLWVSVVYKINIIYLFC